MKNFLSKARTTFSNSQVFPSTTSPYPPSQSTTSQTHQPSHHSLPTPKSLTATTLFRHRFHHGTNLGSIFLLEHWLHPSLFHHASSSSQPTNELSTLSAHISTYGLAATTTLWTTHWNSALTSSDLTWLVQTAGCTSIRLPIGYFTLGERFVRGTPFEPFAAVYAGAWGAVRELVGRCREVGIGVLIDLHGLPGGANGEEHSGGGSGGKAGFWGKGGEGWRRRGRECVEFLVGECRALEGVVGVQIVNEVVFGAEGVWEWYEEVLAMMEKIDCMVPIYISDGWELGKAVEWVKRRRERVRGGNPVVIDTHQYFTFSEKHRNLAPAQIIEKVPACISATNGVSVIVGEYSCVLDGQTWARVSANEKEDYVRKFGQVQSQTWQNKSAGSYFWTLKMEWMDGGEWGFVEQVNKGNITPPAYMRLSFTEIASKALQARKQKHARGSEARDSHEKYWDRVAPSKKMQHERYSAGWTLGFDDAHDFFTARSNGLLGPKQTFVADKLGCLDEWLQLRKYEFQQDGEHVWEWEHGFRAGVAAFNNCVGI